MASPAVTACLHPAKGWRAAAISVPRPRDLPGLTEHALVGGVAALIADRVARGRAAELPAVAPEAIQFALTPYLGITEAKRIASTSR
jgi:hypothetical protein